MVDPACYITRTEVVHPLIDRLVHNSAIFEPTSKVTGGRNASCNKRERRCQLPQPDLFGRSVNYDDLASENHPSRPAGIVAVRSAKVADDLQASEARPCWNFGCSGFRAGDIRIEIHFLRRSTRGGSTDGREG